MYPTCRTDGVWRSLVARPLWERKAVGSNPATPTTSRFRRHVRPRIRRENRRPTADGRDRKIAFWGVYRLRLLCRLRARVSALLRLSRAANPLRLCPISAETNSRTPQQYPQEVSHKETEP